MSTMLEMKHEIYDPEEAFISWSSVSKRKESQDSETEVMDDQAESSSSIPVKETRLGFIDKGMMNERTTKLTGYLFKKHEFQIHIAQDGPDTGSSSLQGWTSSFMIPTRLRKDYIEKLTSQLISLKNQMTEKLLLAEGSKKEKKNVELELSTVSQNDHGWLEKVLKAPSIKENLLSEEDDLPFETIAEIEKKSQTCIKDAMLNPLSKKSNDKTSFHNSIQTINKFKNSQDQFISNNSSDEQILSFTPLKKRRPKPQQVLASESESETIEGQEQFPITIERIPEAKDIYDLDRPFQRPPISHKKYLDFQYDDYENLYRKYKKTRMQQDLVCHLCLKLIYLPVNLSCHTFCLGCIHNYLKAVYICPICKRNVKPLMKKLNRAIQKETYSKLVDEKKMKFIEEFELVLLRNYPVQWREVAELLRIENIPFDHIEKKVDEQLKVEKIQEKDKSMIQPIINLHIPEYNTKNGEFRSNIESDKDIQPHYKSNLEKNLQMKHVNPSQQRLSLLSGSVVSKSSAINASIIIDDDDADHGDHHHHHIDTRQRATEMFFKEKLNDARPFSLTRSETHHKFNLVNVYSSQRNNMEQLELKNAKPLKNFGSLFPILPDDHS